jgi:hypothetical protein
VDGKGGGMLAADDGGGSGACGADTDLVLGRGRVWEVLVTGGGGEMCVFLGRLLPE